MGTLKDIVDLGTQLADKIKDRKSAAELREIIKMVGGMQFSHLALIDESLALKAENAELKKQVSALKRQQAEQDESGVGLVYRLPKQSEKMLAFIANLPQREITKDDLIGRFGFKPAKGGYYFDQLVKHGLIHSGGGHVGIGMMYVATPDGREYLNRFSLFD